ncbi:hypothetical protein [Thalassococcus lentus]|uniref:Uncharacterized protein n=1 Tax=Thalassococcus lentus TaxID=1210524 RepID=A0ABT4XUR8_9RHOB|nr:hypothetical protein [Thalassococcus lentus]MDA7425700.1 hypothetical protein [Thalassococcus lentus]
MTVKNFGAFISGIVIAGFGGALANFLSSDKFINAVGYFSVSQVNEQVARAEQAKAQLTMVKLSGIAVDREGCRDAARTFMEDLGIAHESSLSSESFYVWGTFVDDFGVESGVGVDCNSRYDEWTDIFIAVASSDPEGEVKVAGELRDMFKEQFEQVPLTVGR